MKKKIIIFLVALVFSFSSYASKFPSENELDGILKVCGMGISKGAEVGVSSSIKSWRKAAIKGEAFYSELGAILKNADNGSISTNNYKTYTSCIVRLVQEFNNVDEECENPIYKMGRGEVCGVERYKSIASSECEVLEYNTGSSAACGVDQYYECESGSCGWNSCPFIKKCDAKECRAAVCGVERYKTCKDSSFGVKSYKTCRDENHGVEVYKACRSEEFGVERCG